jgi:hypothetical protein
MLSKIWVWGPGSGIRDPGSGIWKKTYPRSRNMDPGVKQAPDPESRIRNTAMNTGSTVSYTFTSLKERNNACFQSQDYAEIGTGYTLHAAGARLRIRY